MRNLLNFFFPRSVAGVMGAFQKTIDDLHKVAEHHERKADIRDQEAEDLAIKLNELNDKIEAHEREAAAALRMASKLSVHFGLTD
jgi:hypothetical protein